MLIHIIIALIFLVTAAVMYRCMRWDDSYECELLQLYNSLADEQIVIIRALLELEHLHNNTAHGSNLHYVRVVTGSDVPPFKN